MAVSALEMRALKRAFRRDFEQLRMCFVCPAVDAINAFRDGDPDRLIWINDEWSTTASSFIEIHHVGDFVDIQGGMRDRRNRLRPAAG